MPRKFGYDVSVRTTKSANAVRTDSGGGVGASRGKAQRHTAFSWFTMYFFDIGHPCYDQLTFRQNVRL